MENEVRNEIFRQMSLTLTLAVPVRPMDAKGLTISAPQNFTNIIKTRSRLRVWVGIVHIELDFFFFFFCGSVKMFNQLA